MDNHISNELFLCVLHAAFLNGHVESVEYGRTASSNAVAFRRLPDENCVTTRNTTAWIAVCFTCEPMRRNENFEIFNVFLHCVNVNSTRYVIF